jgi:CMP-2-keto-3-deoxyoctulosonic acid synthetase
LERIEKLEQLRFLENWIPIQVATVDEDSIGVDTQEDLERVRPFFENGSLIPSQRPTNIAAEGES